MVPRALPCLFGQALLNIKQGLLHPQRPTIPPRLPADCAFDGGSEREPRAREARIGGNANEPKKELACNEIKQVRCQNAQIKRIKRPNDNIKRVCEQH